MLTVSYVRPLHVGATWPLIKNYVLEVCEISGGRRTPAGVLAQLMDDQASLWVAHDEAGAVRAFATTRICQYDAVTLLGIELLGGEDIDGWLTDENIQLFVRFAKDNGCGGLEGYGRGRAWARKLKAYGWEQVSTVIETRWDK